MIFLIWILSAVGCGILAEKKGRSAVLGVIAGLLFGVFALLVFACLSTPNKVVTENGTIEFEEEKESPAIKMTIKILVAILVAIVASTIVFNWPV